MKLSRAFLLLLFQNAFCILFLKMIFEPNVWGLAIIIIIGLFWLVSFSMCVVGISNYNPKFKDKDNPTN
ncbi:MAG: hypothetical protein PUC12_00540 [Clostridiales bacterium]|nr:hypothetical protein [Clostridiales bacterium]